MCAFFQIITMEESAHIEASAAASDAFKMPGLPAVSPAFKSPRTIQEKKTEVAPLAADLDTNTFGTSGGDKEKKTHEKDFIEKPVQPPPPSVPASANTGAAPLPSQKSPAELALAQSIPVPYQEPSWGGIPGLPYSLEIIKNGSVVETHPLRDKSFFVVGRLANCDIVLEHPSLSRYLRFA
jgi:hypothetical protein